MALARRRARADNPASPAADSSGLTAHPQPIPRTPALTSAPITAQNGEPP
jgi:hypothetical protein